MSHSKRYRELVKKVDAKKIYPLDEAIKLIKETAKIKFDSSVEIHIRLGIDPGKGEQQVRGAITLPNGIGKTKKIVVFTLPEKEKEAQEAGADLVGGQELIDKIKQTGKVDFDTAIATPEMMPKLAVIAKILGPKGLMPSPKNETLTTNVKKTVAELKKGKVSFKNDDTGNVHQIIGKVSFADDKLIENYRAFLEAVRKAKPAAAKGNYFKNITLASTMGPGVKVAIEK